MGFLLFCFYAELDGKRYYVQTTSTSLEAARSRAASFLSNTIKRGEWELVIDQLSSASTEEELPSLPQGE